VSKDVKEDAWRTWQSLGPEHGQCVRFFVLAPVDPFDDVTGEAGAGLVDRSFLGDHVGVGGVPGAGGLAGDEVGVAKVA
jgi:hypothetical protein